MDLIKDPPEDLYLLIDLEGKVVTRPFLERDIAERVGRAMQESRTGPMTVRYPLRVVHYRRHARDPDAGE
jgi:hypothetical protein